MSPRKYKQYPAEFRESSAKLALKTDQPMSQTAHELGSGPIHDALLHCFWKRNPEKGLIWYSVHALLNFAILCIYGTHTRTFVH
ncbi:MAG: hypothetical protein COB14_09570 [Alphaproteobacteria bacterium]|nr:MAG: hypothetical protein COB14_09570 [Alphaproteobacteria bacterium]